MNLGEKMVDRRVLRAEMWWDLVWFIASPCVVPWRTWILYRCI